MNKIFLFTALLFVSTTIMADTNDLYAFNNSRDASRFESLISQIRCVSCQHQTIADSDAPLSEDMKRKLYQLLLAKKSDVEIKRYFTDRYGDSILLQTPLNTHTLFLWLFPLMGLIMVKLVDILRDRECPKN